MLADVLDSALAAEEQLRFDDHIQSCASCSGMLADAQRGAAWLELLREPRPEPPALLVERILARTGTETSLPISLLQPVAAARAIYSAQTSVVPANFYLFPRRGKLLFRSLQHTLLQPRLAMTAAMAFFSIGLTLNLTGVQLNQIKTRELKPSSLRRSFYQANASVVRYYDNLRVVYELESRVHELQHSSEGESAPAPKAPSGEPNTQKPSPPKPGSGSSHQQLYPAATAPQSLALLNCRLTMIKKGELA